MSAFLGAVKKVTNSTKVLARACGANPFSDFVEQSSYNQNDRIGHKLRQLAQLEIVFSKIDGGQLKALGGPFLKDDLFDIVLERHELACRKAAGFSRNFRIAAKEME